MPTRTPTAAVRRFAAPLLARLGELDRSIRDSSRREFLKSGVKGALALGLAGTGFVSETALAFSDANLPPGFQIIARNPNGDQALVNAYASMISSGLYNQPRIMDILTRSGGWVQDVLKRETPLTEPAYWFTVDYFNYKYQQQGSRGMIDTDRNASKFNLSRTSAMFYWAKGINMYFRTWIDDNKNYGSTIETETYLLKAIFSAAGRSESDVEEYKKLDLPRKEVKLRELMADFDLLGAQVKQSQGQAKQQHAHGETSRAAEAKKLDKDIFILEKRLQREKLSYEKEYDLTQQLKALKVRQQNLVNSASPTQQQVQMPSDEYARLLITAWSCLFLNSALTRMQRQDEAVMLWRTLDNPLKQKQYIPNIWGPPSYGVGV